MKIKSYTKTEYYVFKIISNGGVLCLRKNVQYVIKEKQR